MAITPEDGVQKSLVNPGIFGQPGKSGLSNNQGFTLVWKVWVNQGNHGKPGDRFYQYRSRVRSTHKVPEYTNKYRYCRFRFFFLQVSAKCLTGNNAVVSF